METVSQDVGDGGAYGFVPGPPRQLRHNLREVFSPPSHMGSVNPITVSCKNGLCFGALLASLMGHQRLGRQPDLFAPPAASCDLASNAPAQEPPPPDFVARIRAELRDTLARARDADALPWPDLTRTTLAEMRFHSVASWLPPDEARSLRAAFAAEMDRLYARHDAGMAE